MSKRLARRAKPTVFIDDGSIPKDTSAEEKSISNEEKLLNESYSDISDSDGSEESVSNSQTTKIPKNNPKYRNPSQNQLKRRLQIISALHLLNL